MARPLCFLLAPALLLGVALAQAQTTNGGYLDTTFDPGSGPGGGRQRILGAALERSTNRVIVGGDFDTFRGAARPGLVRLLPDGSVDPNFDPGSGINQPSTINQPSPGRDGRVVQSVAMLPDGSAFIGGTFLYYDNVFAQGVSKVTANGYINPSFDSSRNQSNNEENLNPVPPPTGTPYYIPYNGVVPYQGAYVIQDYPQAGDKTTVSRNVTVESLIPLPDGALLVTYRYATKADYVLIKHGSDEARSFTVYFRGSALKRLLPNGLLDPDFQQPSAPPFFPVEAISEEERVGGIYRTVLLADGKILIVGNFAQVNGFSRPGIARLQSNGAVDETFNPASGVLPQLIYNVATQADGKLIIVGDFSVVENTARRRIVRITPDGNTDTTFDSGYGPNQAVREVAVLPNGKIVIAGDFTLYNGVARAGFARLFSSGALDVTFNNSAELSGLPTAGAAGSGPNADTAIFPIRVLLPQDDNKLVVAGEFTLFSATTRNRILRLTADSTGDPGTPTPTDPPVVVGPARLANVSTRGQVGTGDNVLIGGLVVTGSGGNVRVLLRALGPSLAAAGVPGTLQRPVITLKNSAGATVATNDGWQRSADGGAAVSATGLAPSSANEAALTATLPPGAYTAIVSGVSNSTGVALFEAYELSATSPAKLGNLSTRGQVGTGDNVMIGGFVVRADSKTSTRRVVVRAMGPTLAAYNVSGTLSDPVLRVYDSRGTLIIANDNWNDGGQSAALRQLGRQPYDSREAAVVLELPPGTYTAIVSGANSTTGVGLVEAYDVSQ